MKERVKPILIEIFCRKIEQTCQFFTQKKSLVCVLQENEAVRFLQELSEEVCTRLRNISMKGKTVTLKLMVRREDAPKETSKFMGRVFS